MKENELGMMMSKRYKIVEKEIKNINHTYIHYLLQVYENNSDFELISDIDMDFWDFKTFIENVKNLSGWISKRYPKGELIGIFSKNRKDWVLVDLAIMMAGCITVPIYATFGKNALQKVLSETGIRICFVGEEGFFEMNFYVENLILIGNLDLKNLESDNLITKYKKDNDLIKKENNEKNFELEFKYPSSDNIFKISHLKNILKMKNNFKPCRLPKIDDDALICYTSGSTGEPKGVIITHKNLMSIITGYFVGVDQKTVYKLTKDDIYMSYLPLSHVLEHFLVFVMLCIPMKIVFYSGIKKNLQNDFQKVKPTFLVGVPRVFEIFKEKIYSAVPSKIVFNFALRIKYFFQSFGIYKNFILDKLIFNRIRKKFGGRVKAVLSGSASLSPELAKFIQAIFSCNVMQGYGQTESTGIIAISKPELSAVGNVGIPFPTNIVKISDEGELLIKGNNIFKGYFKNPELTKKTIVNGWLKTGDMAIIKNNLITITGRIKNNFKTSFGEYIVPEKIEQIYREIVDDIFIVGNSFKNYIVAIVSSREVDILEKLMEFSNKKVKESILMKFEIPKYYYIIQKKFSELPNVLSETTFKIKRQQIENIFCKEIEMMFNK